MPARHWAAMRFTGNKERKCKRSCCAYPNWIPLIFSFPYKDDGFICSLGTALFGCLCISLGPLDIDIPTHACKRAACGTLSRASIKYNWRNFWELLTFWVQVMSDVWRACMLAFLPRQRSCCVIRVPLQPYFCCSQTMSRNVIGLTSCSNTIGSHYSPYIVVSLTLNNVTYSKEN